MNYKNIASILVFLFFANANAKSLCVDCNIIVIAVDALQAKHTSYMGYNRKTTPYIDQLASQSVVFTQAISPASWTVPTYLSIFSSKYPSVHGLVNRYKLFGKTQQKLNNFSTENPTLEVMAEILKKNGFKTGGFTGDSGLGKVLGYNKGFDEYFDETPFGGFQQSIPQALNWLDKVSQDKFFLFLHGYDPHGQYNIPDNYTAKYAEMWAKKTKYLGTKSEQAKIREQGLQNDKIELTQDDINFWNGWYDSKILNADERVGNFLKIISEKKIKRKTIIVLLSDHGTEFYEHKKFDHGHTLYDELLHVPFMISVPGIKPTKVSSQVSTLDLLPTLLDIAGIKINKQQFDGRSLLQAFYHKSLNSADVYSETDYRNMTHKRSIRTANGWKYIMTLESGEDELYDIKNDPQELLNKVDQNKKLANKLKEKLFKHLDLMKNRTKSHGYFSAITDCLPVYKEQCQY